MRKRLTDRSRCRTQIERFVDQRKIGNDVADDRVLEHRPVLPRRIVRVARGAGGPSAPVSSAISTSPRQPSTQPTPALPSAASETASQCSPSGSSSRIAAHSSQRFEHFLEAHGHACGHVAVAMRGHAHVELIVGRRRKLHAQIPGLRARASRQPDQPSLLGEFRAHRPVAMKRSCRPGCSS